jgi:hypothetical protein
LPIVAIFANTRLGNEILNMVDEDAVLVEEDKSDLRPDRTGKSSPTMIDLEKLADKVFQLMRDELRLEMARGQGMRGR